MFGLTGAIRGQRHREERARGSLSLSLCRYMEGRKKRVTLTAACRYWRFAVGCVVTCSEKVVSGDGEKMYDGERQPRQQGDNAHDKAENDSAR